MRDQFLNEEHAGKAWEDALRQQPTPMEFSHVLVEKLVRIPGREKPIRILIRAEVDVVRDGTKHPIWPQDFEEVACKNPKRKLYVVKKELKDQFPLDLDSILELTIAKNIRPPKVFQSWVVGLTTIIHNSMQPTEVNFFAFFFFFLS